MTYQEPFLVNVQGSMAVVVAINYVAFHSHCIVSHADDATCPAITFHIDELQSKLLCPHHLVELGQFLWVIRHKFKAIL